MSLPISSFSSVFNQFSEIIISNFQQHRITVLAVTILAAASMAIYYSYCYFQASLISASSAFSAKSSSSEKVENEEKALTEDEEKTLELFINGLKERPKDQSMVFTSKPFTDKAGNVYSPGWHRQRTMSKASGFSHDLQKAVEKARGYFLFALEFSNVHSSFGMKEPSIIIRDPLSMDTEPKEFENVEAFYHHCKGLCTRADGTFDSVTWDNTVRLPVMEAAIFAKFTQNPLLREMLLATKDDKRPLLQLKTDPHWGPGIDGKGLNLLGVALENVRRAISEGDSLDYDLTVYKL